MEVCSLTLNVSHDGQIRFTPDHIAKFSERATVTTRRKGAQA